MTTRQIEIFISLVRTKSFTETAKELYMTQPAVSQQIMALESDINQSLFIRRKGGLQLTDAGQAFCEEAELLLAHTYSVYNKVKQAGSSHRIMRTLGYLPPLRILPELIAEFSKLHPDIFISVSQIGAHDVDDSMIFRSHDISVSFGSPAGEYPGLRFIPLYSGGMVCYLRRDHPLAAKELIRPEDLKGENVYAIAEHPGNSLLQRINRTLAGAAGSMFFPRLHGTYDCEVMAASGRCIAIMPAVGEIISDSCVQRRLDIPEVFHLGLFVSDSAPEDILDFCSIAQRLCAADKHPPVIF